MGYPHFLQVNEWLQRKKHGENHVVSVKEHKTGAHYVVVFALSTEEEKWFDTYFRMVRPRLLVSSKKRRREEDDEQDGDKFFFVSSNGKKVHNPTKDLVRLHLKYNLQSVNSQTVRRVFETAANSLDESQKSLVADYLAHSGSTAEKHYRMKHFDSIITTTNLLSEMGQTSR